MNPEKIRELEGTLSAAERKRQRREAQEKGFMAFFKSLFSSGGEATRPQATKGVRTAAQKLARKQNRLRLRAFKRESARMQPRREQHEAKRKAVLAVKRTEKDERAKARSGRG
jgi:hypothetical protein